MSGEILFLGTGSSRGIPEVACNCSVCKSASPRNKRLRTSALISVNGKKLLIDAGPDFRAQALKNGITGIDGLLLTHSHFDHIGGIDDLRSLKKVVPVLLSQDCYDALKKSHYYLFEGYLKGCFEFCLLKDDFGEVEFQGIKINCFSFAHAGIKVTGFRFGNMAYVTDMKSYDERVVETVRGVKILILNAISRDQFTDFHLTLDEASSFAKKAEAKEVWITHISHDMDHETFSGEMKNIRLTYDGLVLKFDYGRP